jgi:hypothetical protein
MAPKLQFGCTLPGGLLRLVNGEGALMEDSAPGAVSGTATVALVGADPHSRDLNADALRHAGYSVIGLATCEQLIALLAGGTAVDCLVVSEGLKPTNARRLVAEVRSLCPELRTIIWELDRSNGANQVCEAVEQILVDTNS